MDPQIGERRPVSHCGLNRFDETRNEMATDTMNPATAVTWGPFIQAAVAQYTSQPSELNPATIKNMPAGYTLVRRFR